MPVERQPAVEVRPRRAAEPGTERSAATRARLLAAAEQLFLQHDPASVSVRTINAAAGLNPGAIPYQFGSKEGLVLALLEDLPPSVDVLRGLTQLENADDVPVRAIVALAVDPLVALASGSERERLWLRLLINAVRSDPTSTFAQEKFSPQRWEALITRALPNLDENVARQRWRYAVSLLLAVIERPTDREALIDFMAGGLEAPVGASGSRGRPAARPPRPSITD